MFMDGWGGGNRPASKASLVVCIGPGTSGGDQYRLTFVLGEKRDRESTRIYLLRQWNTKKKKYIYIYNKYQHRRLTLQQCSCEFNRNSR